MILSGLNVSVGASKESDSAVSKYVSILGFLTSTMRSSVDEISSSNVCCSALIDSSTNLLDTVRNQFQYQVRNLINQEF